MADALAPNGSTVRLAPDVYLRTPGLTGTAAAYQPTGAGTRSLQDGVDAFVAAVERNDVQETLTVEIENPRELDAGSGTRAIAAEDAIELEVPAPADDEGQFLLYVSEDGALSWHLPEGTATDLDAMRGGPTRTFRIPRAVTHIEAAPGQRGLVGALGKKVLKLFAFKIIEVVGEKLGSAIAKRYEDSKRPHRLHVLEGWGEGGPVLTEATGEVLRSYGGRPTLLLIHGTFSSIRGGFGAFDRDTFATLSQRYGGQVLAFDHPTMSRGPEQNAAWLGDLLREHDAELEVDLITHSRGGLIGRVLAESSNLGASADVVTVNRAAFVAGPFEGTDLAHTSHHAALIDRVSNLLRFAPDNGVTDVLEMLIPALKHLALGISDGLPGLISMDPGGDFLTGRLNRGGTTQSTYFSAAADFEPGSVAGLAQFVFDTGADRVFGSKGNDLVVPRDGAHTVTGPHGFQIADPLLFESQDAVWHSSYWGQPRMNEALLTWLT